MTDDKVQRVAKAVRDFYYFFGTLDNPKLEEWIADALKKPSLKVPRPR